MYRNGRYDKFNIEFESNQGHGEIELSSTHSKVQLHQGFNSLDEQLFILTHPVKGYYKLRNNRLGTYEIWHPKMNLHEGKASKAYFEFFEKLGLLNQMEMMQPHSVLITKQIEFDIVMPPKKV